MKTFLFLLLLSSTAYAAPVHYFELLDGDLAGNNAAAPLTAFVVDVGDNTIAGRLNSDTDFDSFQFVVPAGLVVDHVSLLFLPTDTVDWMTCWRIGDLFQNVAFTAAASPFQVMFPTLGTFKAGTYEIDHAYTSGNAGLIGASYTWVIHAATAPLPTKRRK